MTINLDAIKNRLYLTVWHSRDASLINHSIFFSRVVLSLDATKVGRAPNSLYFDLMRKPT